MVYGVFDLKHGAVHFDPATNKIGGEILLDVPSGRSGSDSRDKKMHQQILESARYPDVVFRISVAIYEKSHMREKAGIQHLVDRCPVMRCSVGGCGGVQWRFDRFISPVSGP